MSKKKEAGDNYDVGYKKPPKSSRFKKGNSGNPRGRPKGSRNFKTDLADELSEKIAIQEGGKPKSISKQRALIKSIVAKGIKGDVKAVSTVTNMVIKFLEEQDIPQEAADQQATDDAILKAFAEQVLKDAKKKDGAK